MNADEGPTLIRVGVELGQEASLWTTCAQDLMTIATISFASTAGKVERIMNSPW